MSFVEDQHPRDKAGKFALKGSQGDPGLISTRLVTGKKVADPTTYTRIDTEAMKLNPANMKADLALFKNEDFYPSLNPADFKGTPERQIANIVDDLKDNIKFLYKSAPKDVIAGGQIWYDSAHRLVAEKAKEYGLPVPAVTGVFAKLSPNKDWDQNIAQAQRLIDIYSTKQDHRWDATMQKTSDRIWKPSDKAPPTKQAILDKLVSDIKGKTLGELTDPTNKAMWIRTYDEAQGNPSFKQFLPDGSLGETVKNLDGTPTKMVWQSTTNIADAVTMLESGGDRDVISENLGDRHKVRSFYNNILDPHSPNGDVTIDTHAVGAALLQPLGGKAPAVAQNFGNSVEKPQPPGWASASHSAVTGIKGTYPIYADAYRAAAKDLHVDPQQVQAVVWVQKRMVFDRMTDKKAAEIDQTWHSYHNGKISKADAQNKVMEISSVH